MVKITYVFNDLAIQRSGTTKDALLKSIRHFVAHRPGAKETEYGVFTLDYDENDVGIIGEVLDELIDTPSMRKLFHAIYADVNGERSECISAAEQYDDIIKRYA